MGGITKVFKKVFKKVKKVFKKIISPITSLFKAPKAPKEEPLPQALEPPTREDPAVQAAAEQERKRSLRRLGRRKTILTSGLGAPGEARTGSVSLLGN